MQAQSANNRVLVLAARTLNAIGQSPGRAIAAVRGAARGPLQEGDTIVARATIVALPVMGVCAVVQARARARVACTRGEREP